MEYFILFSIYLFSSFGELISLVLLFLFLCPAFPLPPKAKGLVRALFGRGSSFEANVLVWRCGAARRYVAMTLTEYYNHTLS